MSNIFDWQLKEIETGYFDYDGSWEMVDSFEQRVTLLLNTWKGEFLYNITQGLDYKTALSRTFNARYLETFFIKGLKQLKGFEAVGGFRADYDLVKKIVYVSFDVVAKNGEIVTIKKFKL